MPYKRIGKRIYHKKGGKWRLKQTATSEEKAKATMRLLQGIEHGWRPTGKGKGWHGNKRGHANAARGIKKRKKVSYASVESYFVPIEDIYYSLNKAGLHYSQIGPSLITDKNIYRGKGEYYYRIVVPIKGRKPMMFNTYSSRKDIAQRYVKAFRRVQTRSSPTIRGGYLQGLYKPEPMGYYL